MIVKSLPKGRRAPAPPRQSGKRRPAALRGHGRRQNLPQKRQHFPTQPCKNRPRVRGRGASACQKNRHAAKRATVACRTLLFTGLQFPHPAARLGAALAFCDRCPCSALLCPSQAARGSAALWIPLRQNFTANRALVTSFLAHSCRKISLYVSVPSAHVRRHGRILKICRKIQLDLICRAGS